MNLRRIGKGTRNNGCDINLYQGRDTNDNNWIILT